MTKNKYYAKGMRAERECEQILSNKGFFTLRSAGSLGMFDVFAINKQEVKLIQVKYSKHLNYKLPNKESKKIFDFVNPSNSSKELWVKYDYKGWKTYIMKDNKYIEYNFFQKHKL